MAQYQTPDVYVREKSLLPPSVAEVATAIPAFIGLTEKVVNEQGEPVVLKPTRITNIIEFEALFGGAQQESFSVIHNAESDECYLDSGEQANTTYYLYQAVSHFFANGGGTCYLISIGAHDATNTPLTFSAFKDAIDLLQEVDEVTLLSAPESVLMDSLDHYSVQNYALLHCEKMKERFALVDVKQLSGFNQSDLAEDSLAMRDQVANGLQYGAAYYPYVRTTIARSFDESQVMVSYSLTQNELHTDYSTSFVTHDGTTLDAYGYKSANDGPHPLYINVNDAATVDKMGYPIEVISGNVQRVAGAKPYGIFAGENAEHLNHQGYVMEAKDSIVVDTAESKQKLQKVTASFTASLEYLSNPKWSLASTSVYAKVKSMLGKNYLVLPPSAAVAGIIAQVDASRGVWKAPANVALSQVVEPCVAIDKGEQQDMNVDVIAGKSINAIRSFIGKGSLIWGARTLKGNDNEWRYVSVRRLFNMVEESVQKASHFAVFEPNTPFTWLKLKTMIENYLENLWRQGALFGETPEAAFFVNVGLGQTMTEDDINNGLMNIEIGLAAVRPAEFIVLTFSHKSLEG